MPITVFNTLIASGIVALQAGIVFLCIIFFIHNDPALTRLKEWITQKAHLIIAIVFIGSAVGSFVYEYGYGYAPCLLCWYQRIAIFGVAILSCTAKVQKSALLQKQLFLFIGAGSAIAIFHNIIDIFPSSGVDVCGAGGVSCLIRYVYEFGYITIPMMSLTVLAFGAIIIAIAKKHYR